jgi:hypothetical protein
MARSSAAAAIIRPTFACRPNHRFPPNLRPAARVSPISHPPPYRGDLCCLVEEDAGIEDLEDFWVGKPNCVQVLIREAGENVRQLPRSRRVNPLDQPPVPRRGKGQIVVVVRSLPANR